MLWYIEELDPNPKSPHSIWITPLGVEIRYNISCTNDNELAVGFRSQHLQKDSMVPSASIEKRVRMHSCCLPPVVNEERSPTCYVSGISCNRIVQLLSYIARTSING